MLNRAQAVAFKAQRVKGASAMFTALPVGDFSVSNLIFTYAVNRRFLKEKIGAFTPLDENSVCHIGSCRERASFNHYESCVCTNILQQRHEVVRKQLQHMFTEAGLFFDAPDLRAHQGILDRLSQAGAYNTSGALVLSSGVAGDGRRRRGNHDGADMLLHGLNGPGEETALDFTVVSDRAACRVTASGAAANQAGADESLKGVEDQKFNRYAAMYASINVKMLGVAMDLAGGLGPNLCALIKRCDFLCGSMPPEWANWSAGTTFFSAWRQRIIVAVQMKNAECALSNQGRSKVATAAWAAAGGSY